MITNPVSTIYFAPADAFLCINYTNQIQAKYEGIQNLQADFMGEINFLVTQSMTYLLGLSEFSLFHLYSACTY